jgi:hypothetical protein
MSLRGGTTKQSLASKAVIYWRRDCRAIASNDSVVIKCEIAIISTTSTADKPSR